MLPDNGRGKTVEKVRADPLGRISGQVNPPASGKDSSVPFRCKYRVNGPPSVGSTTKLLKSGAKLMVARLWMLLVTGLRFRKLTVTACLPAATDEARRAAISPRRVRLTSVRKPLCTQVVSARTSDAVGLASTSEKGFVSAIRVLFVVGASGTVGSVEPAATWEVGFAETAASLVASGAFLAVWIGPQATADRKSVV